MTLAGWLELSLQKHKSLPALRAGSVALTYSDLAEKSAAFAAELSIEPGSLVALHVPKSPEAVIAILALYRLGAAYAAIDVRLPEARKRKLVESCRPALALGSPVPGVESVPIACSGPGGGPFAGSTEAQLAYCFFTSGSTGEPKRIGISQGAALAFSRWAAERVALRPGDRVAGTSSLGFDLSTFEIFSTLGSGAEIVLTDPALALQPARLAEHLRREKVTVFYSVPSTIRFLEGAELPGLRALISAGDAFPAQAAAKIKARSGCTLHNWYGPTETNVCLAHEVTDEDLVDVPVGAPAAGAVCSLLDENGAPVPDGVTGELFVGGPSVFMGAPGGVHATGDLLVRKNGLFYFRGRKDDQVKCYGYRVQPLEVEKELERLPGVKEAAVVAVPEARAGHELRAFVVAAGTSARDLLAVLSEALPAYMVPSSLEIVDALPRTPNGKIDRKLLRNAP